MELTRSLTSAGSSGRMPAAEGRCRPPRAVAGHGWQMPASAMPAATGGHRQRKVHDGYQWCLHGVLQLFIDLQIPETYYGAFVDAEEFPTQLDTFFSQRSF